MRRLTCLASLLAAAPGAPAPAAPPSPGDGFQVERYAVALRPDLATRAVSGTETILVQSTTDELAQIAFSPNALRISDAMSDGLPVEVSSSEKAIVFKLPRTLRRGAKAVLRLRFDGVPARGLKAAAGGVYASYFACDWMICLQDSPGDKAALLLDLLLPRAVQSVGVGRALAPRNAGGGMVVHRWRSTRPYSPYLYAFAAGTFVRQSLRTAAGELAYLDGTSGRADLRHLFAEAPGIAAFLADKAGMPLPDGRYAQLLVPGKEAQESASFSLIGEAELAAERDDPQSAWVIAHEMAHQWWGNLVTCATWQDFWLHEGMATFMVAAWREQRFGPAAYKRELDVARQRVERVRAIGFDKPLTWGGKYPSLGARRAVQYSKGALFLAELRQRVGDRAFWDGIRAFTKDNAPRTVTSQDFQLAMERASKQDLSGLFNLWVYGDRAAGE